MSYWGETLMERLEDRRLLATYVAYDFIGSSAWIPPQGTPYTSTGNQGDRYLAEPGVSATHPVGNFFHGYDSGDSVSFSVTGLAKHTELQLSLSYDVNIEAGGWEPLPPDPPPEPEGYWLFELEWSSDNFSYSRWWDSTGGWDGDSLHFVHTDDSLDVTFTATWVGENEEAAGWHLGRAIVSRSVPSVFMYARDTAVEGKDDYAQGQEPGFVIWRNGDAKLGALQVNLTEAQGTADSGSDYSALPATVTIPAGQSEVFVPLNTVDNNQREWTEDVITAVAAGDLYEIATTGDVIAHIKDDDGADIEADGLPEEEDDPDYNETDPGVFLRINIDDDNNNGQPDGLEDEVNLNDDDLQAVTLKFPDAFKAYDSDGDGPDAGDPQADVTLQLNSTMFRIWSTEGDLLLGGPGGPTSVLLNHVVDGPQMTVLVEAVPPTPNMVVLYPTAGAVSLVAGDVGARPTTTADYLTLTGFKADLDVTDSAAIPIPEEDEDDPGAWVSQTTPATLHVMPINSEGFTRTLSWNGFQSLIVVKDSGGNVVQSGTVVPGDGTEQYTVLATPAFASVVGREVPILLSASAGDFTVEDEVTLHMRAVTVKWVGLATSALDGNPNANGGKRIFPDKQSPTDAIARDLVDVEATIRPLPPAGTTVYFRSFDVDDPSADSAPLDAGDVLSAGGTLPRGGDNRGETPGNRGSFVGGGINYGASATTDSSGKAKVRFQTTMQPGDNFRVAAALSNVALDELTTFVPDEPNPIHVVFPDNEQLPGVNDVGLTEMLTVWRRLWIERDAMVRGGVNSISGNITSIRTAPWPEPGRTTLYHWLMIDIDPNWQEFEGGILAIPSLGKEIAIVGNTNQFTANPGGRTELIVKEGDITQEEWILLNAGGVPFSITDDDDPGVLGTTASPRLAHGGDLLWPAYGSMFIYPIYADSYNSNVTVLFDRNVSDAALYGEPPYDNARDLASSPNFWASLVVAAFEPGIGHDADPDPMLLDGVLLPIFGESAEYGITVHSVFTSNLSLIYLETIRDMAGQFTDEEHTFVHELTHAGRDDNFHAGWGLLMEGAPSGQDEIDDDTKAKIRGKLVW